MELQDGIKLAELLRGPTTFKVNLSNLVDSAEQEALTDSGVDDEATAQCTPWLESFESLRANMHEVPNNVRDGKIFKRTVKNGVGEPMGVGYYRFQWTYSMFYEKDLSSFDSSHFADSSVRTNNTEELFPGICLALATMRRHEEAEFIIDYRLMFGKCGIVAGDGSHLRRPCADILLCAKLHEFVESIGSSLDDIADGPSTFEDIKGTAAAARTSMVEAKAKHHHALAIQTGLKAIQLLQFSITTGDDERAERIALLVQIYTDLVDCYVVCENWQRALAICKDLGRLTDVSKSARLLAAQAIASSHVNDDYKESIELLRKAQAIEPHNKVVNAKLGEYVKADRQQQSNASEFCRRAFGVVGQRQAPKSADDQEMASLVSSIERMDIGGGMPLVGYTQHQIAAIEAVIKRKDNIVLEKSPDAAGNVRYTLKRITP